MLGDTNVCSTETRRTLVGESGWLHWLGYWLSLSNQNDFPSLRSLISELEASQLVVMSVLFGAGIGLVVCRLFH